MSLYDFDVLMQHMKDKHPDSKWFGDSVIGTLDGKVIFQKCQICGEDLTASKPDDSGEKET